MEYADKNNRSVPADSLFHKLTVLLYSTGSYTVLKEDISIESCLSKLE